MRAMAVTPPSKRRKLAQQLSTPFSSSGPGQMNTGVAKRTSNLPFTQKTGARKGQQYNVVTGKSGLSVRKYASGATAIAETDSGVNIAAQRRDRKYEGNTGEGSATAPKVTAATSAAEKMRNRAGRRYLARSLGRGK
jgi:hypothetical protein